MVDTTDSSHQKEFAFTRKDFDRLREKSSGYTGIQVGDDKFDMYYARLASKIRKLKVNSFAEYIKRVETDEHEFMQFINAITTNVTSFSREQHHFDYLKAHLAQQPQGKFRIWSAGCSTGQEPYTLIINLWQTAKQKNIQLDITATDLDTNVLQTASEGIYPIQAIDEFSKTVKQQFFVKGKGRQEGKCRVKPEFRQLIQFKQLNLIQPWQFEQPFDVIFCRNVIIYFDVETKKQLIGHYHDHLTSHGLLFLGHSESLHRINNDFNAVGKTIYRRCT